MKRIIATGINVYSNLAEEVKSTLEADCAVYWQESRGGASGHWRHSILNAGEEPVPEGWHGGFWQPDERG